MKSLGSPPLSILPGLTLFLLLEACLIVSIILFAPIYSSLNNTYNKYNNISIITYRQIYLQSQEQKHHVHVLTAVLNVLLVNNANTRTTSNAILVTLLLTLNIFDITIRISTLSKFFLLRFHFKPLRPSPSTIKIYPDIFHAT